VRLEQGRELLCSVGRRQAGPDAEGQHRVNGSARYCQRDVDQHADRLGLGRVDHPLHAWAQGHGPVLDELVRVRGRWQAHHQRRRDGCSGRLADLAILERDNPEPVGQGAGERRELLASCRVAEHGGRAGHRRVRPGAQIRAERRGHPLRAGGLDGGEQRLPGRILGAAAVPDRLPVGGASSSFVIGQTPVQPVHVDVVGEDAHPQRRSVGGVPGLQPHRQQCERDIGLGVAHVTGQSADHGGEPAVQVGEPAQGAAALGEQVRGGRAGRCLLGRVAHRGGVRGELALRVGLPTQIGRLGDELGALLGEVASRCPKAIQWISHQIIPVPLSIVWP
jgi:hypothetical protein